MQKLISHSLACSVTLNIVFLILLHQFTAGHVSVAQGASGILGIF